MDISLFNVLGIGQVRRGSSSKLGISFITWEIIDATANAFANQIQMLPQTKHIEEIIPDSPTLARPMNEPIYANDPDSLKLKMRNKWQNQT